MIFSAKVKFNLEKAYQLYNRYKKVSMSFLKIMIFSFWKYLLLYDLMILSFSQTRMSLTDSLSPSLFHRQSND